MEFKIDTKDTYTIITPVYTSIDTNLTDALAKKCAELTDSGTNNYIIDLQNCNSVDKSSLQALLQMHEDSYNNSRSLVFTGLQSPVMQVIKDEELDESINIAPKMIEAVDIISMEILERDLFGEE
jgi:anti-anti-sigma factor